MAHFAKLDENGIVLEIICIHNNELLDELGNESEQKGIDFLTNWSGGYLNWKQTSYNDSFRKNFAGIGHRYDLTLDAFIPLKPFDSWILNEETCQWKAPTDYPIDGKLYFWDEETVSWLENNLTIEK